MCKNQTSRGEIIYGPVTIREDGSMLRHDASQQFVLVPLVPTEKMLSDAWASATAEDAAGVWRDMIESWIGREAES